VLKLLIDFLFSDTLLAMDSLSFLLYDFDLLENGLKLRLAGTSLIAEYATIGALKPAYISQAQT
jgi:hypothetical protein